MKAGRELDALVEEHVFHRKVAWVGPESDRVLCYYPPEWRDPAGPGGMWVNPVKPRSTSIASAWEVVEKMQADGWFWDIGNEVDRRGEACWTAQCDDFSATHTVSALTAPLAICLAALKAVGVEVPNEA